MPGEWGLLRLVDVCRKIGSGATPRGGSSVYVDRGDVALIRSQNVYNDGFDHDGIVYLTDAHANELANVEVEPDDVLLNITGDSVARCCLVDPRVLPARVNQHVAIIRPEPTQLDARFLRYFLVSSDMQAKMLSWAGAGGTRNALTKGMIESFQVFAPRDIQDQRAIARVLGSLDDKIELNRRMNRTLEQMAAAIFKVWFVDFEPVKAKAAGAKHFPTMPQPVFDALPTIFADSPLGPIPKGWRASAVGDEVKVCGGSTPSTENPAYWDGGTHAWATPKDLSKLDSPILLETERRITDAGLGCISSGLLPRGTLLLSSRAPIGYLALAETPTAINQGFIAMVCAKSISAAWMLDWCRYNADEIVGRANGTTFLEISKSSFRPMPLVVPHKPILDAFDGFVGPLYQSVAANLRQNKTLAAIRDALLPKLLSGEIRVKAAAKTVEEVA